MPVCSTCREMAKEESEGFGLSPTQVAIQMGDEIADHICEGRDQGRKCSCACNRRR